MSAPVAFPLARRRDLVRRLAVQVIARPPEKAERHLEAQLRRQGKALRDKGVADDVVGRELSQLVSAVRREVWRAILLIDKFPPAVVPRLLDMSTENPRGHHRFRWIEAVLASRVLTPAEKILAVRLGHHCNDRTGRCDPGEAVLADGCGLCGRYVRMLKRSLKAKGWIRYSENRGGSRNGRGISNQYILLMGHVPSSEPTRKTCSGLVVEPRSIIAPIVPRVPAHWEDNCEPDDLRLGAPTDASGDNPAGLTRKGCSGFEELDASTRKGNSGKPERQAQQPGSFVPPNNNLIKTEPKDVGAQADDIALMLEITTDPRPHSARSP